MHKRVIVLFSLVLAALVTANLACVTTKNPAANKETNKAPLLNSERIKQKFGTYGVQVIDSGSPRTRISKLYSVHDGRQIGRTVAVTTFAEPMDASLLEGHRLITEKNQSIGSTFKDLGWSLSKQNLYFGLKSFDSPCLYLMMEVKTQSVAVHVYQLLLSKGEKKNVPYAIIAELQHPDYLTLDELKNIYGEATTIVDINQIWQSLNSAINKLKC